MTRQVPPLISLLFHSKTCNFSHIFKPQFLRMENYRIWFEFFVGVLNFFSFSLFLLFFLFCLELSHTQLTALSTTFSLLFLWFNNWFLILFSKHRKKIAALFTALCCGISNRLFLIIFVEISLSSKRWTFLCKLWKRSLTFYSSFWSLKMTF